MLGTQGTKAFEPWPTLHCKASVPEAEAGTPSPQKNHRLPLKPPVLTEAQDPALICPAFIGFLFILMLKETGNIKGKRSPPWMGGGSLPHPDVMSAAHCHACAPILVGAHVLPREGWH